tara:strand:- start:41 stop:334 length:294 start_codon:yes stop_codon:yes gene_type:complete
MAHRLDHGKPLFPGAPGEEATDLSGKEREAFFQKLEDEGLEALRLDRNALLAESDWTQNPDIPEETKNKWLKYRQELRDITKTYKNPGEVVFPDKPE